MNMGSTGMEIMAFVAVGIFLLSILISWISDDDDCDDPAEYKNPTKEDDDD